MGSAVMFLESGCVLTVMFLELGWVLTVMHMKPANTTITVFRTDVVPSFRINDILHHPRAAARDSGEHGKYQQSSQEVHEAMACISMLKTDVLFVVATSTAKLLQVCVFYQVIFWSRNIIVLKKV